MMKDLLLLTFTLLAIVAPIASRDVSDSLDHNASYSAFAGLPHPEYKDRWSHSPSFQNQSESHVVVIEEGSLLFDSLDPWTNAQVPMRQVFKPRPMPFTEEDLNSFCPKFGYVWVIGKDGAGSVVVRPHCYVADLFRGSASAFDLLPISIVVLVNFWMFRALQYDRCTVKFWILYPALAIIATVVIGLSSVLLTYSMLNLVSMAPNYFCVVFTFVAWFVKWKLELLCFYPKSAAFLFAVLFSPRVLTYLLSGRIRRRVERFNQDVGELQSWSAIPEGGASSDDPNGFTVLGFYLGVNHTYYPDVEDFVVGVLAFLMAETKTLKALTLRNYVVLLMRRRGVSSNNARSWFGKMAVDAFLLASEFFSGLVHPKNLESKVGEERDGFEGVKTGPDVVCQASEPLADNDPQNILSNLVEESESYASKVKNFCTNVGVRSILSTLALFATVFGCVSKGDTCGMVDKYKDMLKNIDQRMMDVSSMSDFVSVVKTACSTIAQVIYGAGISIFFEADPYKKWFRDSEILMKTIENFSVLDGSHTCTASVIKKYREPNLS